MNALYSTRITIALPLGLALTFFAPAVAAAAPTSIVAPLAAPGGPFGYFTLPPCRVFDTRQPANAPALQTGVERSIQVAGTCGVPVDAQAVAINVTVTQATARGHVELYAADSPGPHLPVINFAAGQTRANNAIGQLDGSGSGDFRVRFFTPSPGQSVHFIVDVSGYFKPGDAAPSVTSTTPANSATGVSGNANLVVTWSEPVDVTGNWFQIVCGTSGTRNVADTVVSGGPTTFTINPNADFAAGEVCAVTIFAAQVSDQDVIDPPDHPVADANFGFSIDAAPAVTATTPANGAANQVANTNLTLTWSEPVNVTGNWFQIVCGASGTRNVADTVVSGGPTTFTINPNADFAAGETCMVTVFAAQVSDQDANDPPDHPTANYVSTFTIDAAPSVAATTPIDGATNRAPDTNLTVTFSEPVNVAGNWFQIICGASGTRNVADTVISGGPTTFTINPNVDFTGGESCTVTVFAAQVSDQDANDPPDHMLVNDSFNFSVDVPPSVSTTTPASGATDRPTNINLTITWNKPVNVSGNWFQIVCGSSGTHNVADTVVSGGPQVFTIDPNADFASGESCTATVFAAQVTDQDAGVHPTANSSFTFTFDAAPSVASTVPTNGATGVAANAVITINFSETVNAANSSFSLECPVGSPRAFGLGNSGSITFTLTPTVPLPAGTVCQVTVVAAQTSDADTNDPPDFMAANYVFTFTVSP
jgi:methionine-rich copper-binding protein CopC